MKKLFAILLVCALVLSLGGCDLDSIKEQIKQAAANAITSLAEKLLSGGDDYGGSQEPEETKPPIDQVLDLSQGTKVEKFYEDYYVFTGATREMAEDYIRQITEAGYEQFSDTVLENVAEEYLFQEFGYGEWGEHCTVCFYKDTLVLGLDQQSYFRGDLMLLAGVPQEQIPEHAPLETPENTALPDWSAATPLTLGEYNCKELTGVSYQQVENYAQWMACRNDIYGGMAMMDNHPVDDFLFIQELTDVNAGAYADFQVVVWYDGTAILADVGGSADFDEYVLWTYLDARVSLGENFLRKELVRFRSNYVGSGGGNYLSGMYSFAENCTAEDYENVKASIIQKGYVEDAEETDEGGRRRYFAMRKAPCGDGWYTEVFYELILEADGYMEAEVSFAPEEGTNRD